MRTQPTTRADQHKQENIMKTSIKHIVPWLAVAGIAGAIAAAPLANAAPDPCTPYGTDPMSPCIFGYHAADSVQYDSPF